MIEGIQSMKRVPLCSEPSIQTPVSYRKCIFAWTLLATGCAWQNPRNDAYTDAQNDGPPVLKRCSLEQDQARKAEGRDPEIAGLATPFIIYPVQGSAADRFIRNRDAVYFAISTDSAAPSDVQWSLEMLDPGGRPIEGNTPLASGTLIRLQPAAAAGKNAVTDPKGSGAGDFAPPFMIIKADVPDQTRPATCDDEIRKGDFVFIHSISPSIWLGATPAGGLNVIPEHRLKPDASKNGTSDPNCTQDREICHTDEAGGGFVCAWAPSCAK
jgi:hypothetical protein